MRGPLHSSITKLMCLNGFRQFPYEERLRRLDLQSLELRRLHVDLIWCYKVVFGLHDTDMNDFFKFNTRITSRGHRYKLYKERAITGTRYHFFSERVINAWNSLPTELDFTSLNRFRRAIVNVDFSAFTKCF